MTVAGAENTSDASERDPGNHLVVGETERGGGGGGCVLTRGLDNRDEAPTVISSVRWQGATGEFHSRDKHVHGAGERGRGGPGHDCARPPSNPWNTHTTLPAGIRLAAAQPRGVPAFKAELDVPAGRHR